ncbi:MAG: Histidinol-phosphatase [Firmicutes bacterium]|nr:Histidinol-phosphatase [Bacillota bacterium]
MILIDSHTHSSCSPDGTVPMIQMAQGAMKAGVTDLCITDHCDFLTLDGTARTTTYDWAPVFAQWLEMKAAYGNRLNLSLGLEFGMGHLDAQAAQQVLSLPELDFVIGSVHNLTETEGGKDFYFLPYETEGDCYRALDNYFSSMEALSRSPFYDVLGHIIYPLRYMTGGYERPISLYRYTDHIRSILKNAVEAGRGMEVNTWKGKTLVEWRPILELYRESRGEIITVGSDAHDPAPVGAGIRDAYAMLTDLGFRYVASYQQRKPTFIKL